jgi:ferrochelatase
MARIAVVLFNLGGPDDPGSVRPFLFNLFNDPAIIAVPGVFRWLLAHLMAARRAPTARRIYDHLGGKSPLLANTLAQAKALAEGLADIGEIRAFIAMRYWQPMSDETALEVADFRPDQVILLPLYPQYSTTTTGSSIGAWNRAARVAGVTAPTRAVCCYPTDPGFVAALAALTRAGYDEAGAKGRPRILFSAHGLPEKIVKGGDPYQWQVERTAEAVVEALALDGLDWVVCYQSRVGPLRWIGPAIDEEIVRAGGEGRPIVVVPIAFVSEHSETLVELDIEYRRLAEENDVPGYVRVPTVGVDAPFIGGLAALVRAAAGSEGAVCSGVGGRFCPADWRRCPFAEG